MKYNILILAFILGVVVGACQVTAAPCSYIINVKDFGAVGDGVVDDTSAIRTAVAAAGGINSTEPRVVFFRKSRDRLKSAGGAVRRVDEWLCP